MKKLGFGLMRLPVTDPLDRTSIDMDQLCRMVDTCLERGFTYFDTAYMYHDFTSELAVREALVNRHPRDSFLLADKLPLSFLRKTGDQERIFAEQLEKCGVDYFDYYLLHDVGTHSYQKAQKYDSFRFVAEQKSKGLVKNMGFSFHDRAELLDEILAAHPEVDFVQLQINYLDWEDGGIQSRLCLEAARKHGKPVIVMEPVKGGTLAKMPKDAEAPLRALDPNMSIASWAIRFAAGCEGVMLVLSGMSDMSQLLDNLGYMEDFQPLNTKETEAVMAAARVIRSAVAIPCTACRYCVDHCPQGIPIPEFFALYNAEKQALNKDFSIHSDYYSNLGKAKTYAGACVQCGLCEQHCPQHLDIRGGLQTIAKHFGK